MTTSQGGSIGKVGYLVVNQLGFAPSPQIVSPRPETAILATEQSPQSSGRSKAHNPEARSPKPETLNPKPETYLKPQTLNLKLNSAGKKALMLGSNTQAGGPTAMKFMTEAMIKTPTTSGAGGFGIRV